jgi:catechol 2,3-dioxygenase-like lactoylglutathione lyase family enzyme
MRQQDRATHRSAPILGRDRPEDASTSPHPEDAYRSRAPLVPSLNMKVALDHCVIHVSDWSRSNAFYRDVLGAELVQRGHGWAYRFGREQLNVHGPGVEATPVARVPVSPGGSDLCFVWSGPIDGVLAHLANLGVEVELGPVLRHGAGGQGISVYFRDPDGSLMEFISYVDELPEPGTSNAGRS